MANEIFIDTSGFFALLVKADDQHSQAEMAMRAAQRKKRRFVTSDYVLDETATLLKARGYHHLLSSFFDVLLASTACRIEWTDADRFAATRKYFLKHLDQAWSFTDCLSFRLMTEFRLHEVLTKDDHFRQAGFGPLLA